MKQARTLCAVMCLLLLFIIRPFHCAGQDLFDDDDDLSFEDTPIEINAFLDGDKEKKTALDRFLADSTLTLGYTGSYGTGQPSQMIENQLFLRMDYQTLPDSGLFFKFDGKTRCHLKNDHVAEARDKTYFFDARIRETYFQKGFENASLTIGKVIRVWGKADAGVATDILSPRDFSRYIFTELEDARTGQWMAAASFFAQASSLFVFVSPWPGTDIEPVDGSRYHREIPGLQWYHIQKDEPGFGDMELGGKFDKTIGKTDISLMAGSFYANAPVYHTTGGIENGKRILEKTYPGFSMAGAAVTHAWNSFLFKLELAFKHDFPLQGINADSQYIVRKNPVIDSAVGVEYNANDKYQVYLELSSRMLPRGTENLAAGIDENSTAFYTTFTRTFINQTLDLQYSFYHHIHEKNQFHKIRLTYDLTDNLEITTEYACFNIKDETSLMWLYKNEDRIGFEVKYYF